MKITLAINIYNKEKWIESLLDSWISNLSKENEYEIIVVFDACRDRSAEIAEAYLSKCPYEYKFFYADDKYEIFCHNLALENATGDYIVFIQDDNWIYDKNWDTLLEQVLKRVDNVGVIGFLAGVRFVTPIPFWCKSGLSRISRAMEGLLSVAFNRIVDYRDGESIAARLVSKARQVIHDKSVGLDAFTYRRIEIDRPHKGDNFHHNVDSYKLGVWRVDTVVRPFCVSRELIASKGGLDKEFMPTCGDDLDLSLKLLKEGKTNIYIPFDLLNTVSGKGALSGSTEFAAKSHHHAIALCRRRHHSYLEGRKDQHIEMLMPLRIGDDGALQLDERCMLWVAEAKDRA